MSEMIAFVGFFMIAGALLALGLKRLRTSHQVWTQRTNQKIVLKQAHRRYLLGHG
jgi:hypothetical protein